VIAYFFSPAVVASNKIILWKHFQWVSPPLIGFSTHSEGVILSKRLKPLISFPVHTRYSVGVEVLVDLVIDALVVRESRLYVIALRYLKILMCVVYVLRFLIRANLVCTACDIPTSCFSAPLSPAEGFVFAGWAKR